jgi:hypothetical protein
VTDEARTVQPTAATVRVYVELAVVVMEQSGHWSYRPFMLNLLDTRDVTNNSLSASRNIYDCGAYTRDSGIHGYLRIGLVERLTVGPYTSLCG